MWGTSANKVDRTTWGNGLRSSLEASGFKVLVVDQDSDDPTLDGIVISQEPPGSTLRKPGSTVTIFVGRFVEPPPTGTETETVPITP